MSQGAFVESGMAFGLNPEKYRCYRIEQGNIYQGIGDRPRMAECLMLRIREEKPPPLIFVIEAKSSSPRPETRPNFDEFIREIRKKLSTALSLSIAIFLERHPVGDGQIPSEYREINLSDINFRLVLVIKGHKKEWLPPLQEKLQRALRPTVRIRALRGPSVLVMNDEIARKNDLIREAMPLSP